MNYLSSTLIFFVIVISVFSCKSVEISPFENTRMKLWYDKPASEWVEALPVGNGRIGAMIFGDTIREKFQINEESLFAGLPINDNNPQALENLPKLRSLLFAGKNLEAIDLAENTLLATPPRLRSYQTLMDVDIEWNWEDPILDYRRELNLISGVHKTTFKVGKTDIKQEVFASAIDNVIIAEFTADGPDKLNLQVSLSRSQDAELEVPNAQNLLLYGQISDQEDPLRGPGGKHMKFAGLLRVFNQKGEITALENALQIRDAEKVLFLITAATDYNLDSLNMDPSNDPVNTCQILVNRASIKNIERLKDNHVNSHASMMNRFGIKLGKNDTLDMPIDQRLDSVKAGKKDHELMAIYTQYGRYLLLGSSRYPGVLPANLQGIWCKDIEAPWNADYHTNINLQMNYWPAEAGNLSETAGPVINFMDKYRKPGQVTAKETYGASGWTMHHNTTVFGRTGLHDGIQWGTFPMGGPWMTFPVWRHFAYTQDTTFLKEKAWPILKGSAEFVLDFLVEGPEGYLVTNPSYSPENTFIHPQSGKEVRLTYAPTMDIQIIMELFNYTIKASEILDEDAAFRKQLKETLSQLPPVKVGADGTIQEWIQDYKEAEPGHRHISHLLGLHPGSSITANKSELFAAARKTIEKRLMSGGGHTGWSRAWIINFYARLFDGNEALKHLQLLLAKSTLPNLFDTHPPFQIDGNFGGSAGVMEMLLQSHNNEIHILPALPDEWDEGRVSGIKAIGNFELDISWENKQLTNLKVTSIKGGPCVIRYGSKTREINAGAGDVYYLNDNLNIVQRQ